MSWHDRLLIIDHQLQTKESQRRNTKGPDVDIVSVKDFMPMRRSLSVIDTEGML